MAGQVQVRVSAEGFAPQVLNLVVVAHGATHAFELTPLEPSGRRDRHMDDDRRAITERSEVRMAGVRPEFNQLGTRLQSRISGPTLTVHFPQPTTGTVLGSRVRLQLPGDAD